MGRGKSLERERFWRGKVKEQQASGASIAEFCRDRGLSAASFYSWRRKLARRSAAERFVAVELPLAPAPPCEIVLPDGCRVIVPSGHDARSLRSILSALREEVADA